MRVFQDYMSIQKIDRQKSLIALPDGVADKVDKEADLFLVKDVGPGHYENGKLIIPEVKKGDIVFIIGPCAQLKKDKDRYLFARARDVVAGF